MDDLTKLCDELENCKKNKLCYANEVVCTKSKLKIYIGEDTNKILKLKAQIKIHNSHTQGDISIISLLVSLMTLCVTIIAGLSDSTTIEYIIYCIFGLMGLLVIIIIFNCKNKKYGYRNKWRRYIEAVLEDMDNE